jgi:all-trans-retinol dehydrogenase (NAD+)
MTQIAGRTVLVTGAGSGIGRRMARKLADRGARLVLWDIDLAAAERVAATLREESGRDAFVQRCDVADRGAVYAAAEAAEQSVGPIDVLVNNAGVVTGKPFLECPDEDIELTIGVNTMALFWTTKAFLPGMIRRDRGHLVTVASSAGLVGVARLADYCASKWAAVGFDESLRVELRRIAPGVKTTVVCPYFIDTGMFEGARTRFPRLLPILKEERVAEAIVRAIERDRPRLVLPPFVRLTPLLKFFPPAIFDRLHDFFGVNDTMVDFIGRQRRRKAGK